MIQRLFWLAHLVLITLAAALGAHMTVSYLSGQLSQSMVSEEGPSDRTTQDTVRRPASDYVVIAQRNIFNANPPSDKPQVKAPTPVVTKRPPPLPGPTPITNLKLTGTAMNGDGNHYAFIEDTATRGNQQLYQVGDVIKDRTIIEIRNNCVILQQNDRPERLCFLNHQDSETRAPERQRISNARSDAAGDDDEGDEDSRDDVVQVDDATWRIRRELMQEQFADLGGLSQQARVTPYTEHGETRGFRVTRLKANSLLQKIGLQHNDVLHKVNGSSLTSPADALQVYQQLQQAGTVRLEILRRDRALTLTYEIR